MRFTHALFLALTVLVPALCLPIMNTVTSESRVAQIALLHMHDSVSFFQRLGTLTGQNKQRYAKTHGYDFIVSTPKRTRGVLKRVDCPSQIDITNSNGMIRGPDDRGYCYEDDTSFDIDHTRAPTFGKIKLTLSSCIGREDAWIFWSDADAMVINQTVPLESVIDDAYDIIYSVDWLMLNAGMLFIKCSPWAKTFLENVYNARKFDSARALDQSALQSHIDNLSQQERNMHIKIIPKSAMDVYTEEYRPGDFLVHFAGKLYEATEPGLFAIANQFDILSMVEDIEDIEAFFRGRRFLNYYSGTCNCSNGQHLDCKSEDPRRILFKEPLGSMSVPNRYRHVGLRYYWLHDWKDVYEVPGWDNFKAPLRILSATEKEERHQRGQTENLSGGGADIGDSDPNEDLKNDPAIRKSEHKEEEKDNGKDDGDVGDGDDPADPNAGDDDNKDDKDGTANVGEGDGEGGGGEDDDDTKDKEKTDDEAENANVKNADADGKSKQDTNGDSDKVDDEDGKRFSWHTVVLVLGFSMGLFGIVTTLRARKKMSSKTH